MAIVRLQGEKEIKEGLYYEFDPSSKPLGEGGMGKVYRGKRVNVHTHETRDVAIKFMFSGLHQTIIDRARREANIIIRHENLIEMMGFFTVDYSQQDGSSTPRYHVVSEFLQGVTLADMMQGTLTDQYGNPVEYAKKLYALYNNDPYNFAVVVTKKLLSGIMALHDAGYIHRDIDPSNIMITVDEKIKLIDFGIAKRIDGLVTHDKNLTTAGIFMGKPQYAAPELALGDIKNQKRETDIYAIGILMYQLITGHLPFDGSTNQILHQHIHAKMPLKNIKDRGLKSIIKRATEKETTQRFHSAAEMRAAIENPPRFPWKVILGFIVGALFVLGIFCGVIFGVSKCDRGDGPDTPYVKVLTIREKLLSDDIELQKEGFKELNDSAELDPDYKFLLAELYTIDFSMLKPLYSDNSMDKDFGDIQDNLTGSKLIESDPNKAYKLFNDIREKDNTYYKALYELARYHYAIESGKNGDGTGEIIDAFKYAKEKKDGKFIKAATPLYNKYF